MDKPGWKNYNSTTFGGTGAKINLLTHLILHIVVGRLTNTPAPLRDFNSEFAKVVTKRELQRLYKAISHWADEYMKLNPRPKLAGNLTTMCTKFCVDNFEDALKAIIEFNFS